MEMEPDAIGSAISLLPDEYKRYYDVIAEPVSSARIGSTWLQYQTGWIVTSRALNTPLYQTIMEVTSIDDLVRILADQPNLRPNDRLTDLLRQIIRPELRSEVFIEFRRRLSENQLEDIQTGEEEFHDEAFWIRDLQLRDSSIETPLYAHDTDPRDLLAVMWGHSLAAVIGRYSLLPVPTQEELQAESDEDRMRGFNALGQLVGIELDWQNRLEGIEKFDPLNPHDRSQLRWNEIGLAETDWAIETGATAESAEQLERVSISDVVGDPLGTTSFDSCLILAPSNERWIWIRESGEAAGAVLVEHGAAAMIIGLMTRVWTDSAREAENTRRMIMETLERSMPPRCRVLVPVEALNAAKFVLHLDELASPVIGCYGYAHQGLYEWKQRVGVGGLEVSSIVDQDTGWSTIVATSADGLWTLFKLVTPAAMIAWQRSLKESLGQVHDQTVITDIVRLWRHLPVFWPQL